MPRKKIEEEETKYREEVDKVVETPLSPLVDVVGFEEKIIIPETKLPKPPQEAKIKTSVLLITKSAIVLVDNKGNGINIPITEKTKKLKIGDVYYI